jgi:hypothetical protein
VLLDDLKPHAHREIFSVSCFVQVPVWFSE